MLVRNKFFNFLKVSIPVILKFLESENRRAMQKVYYFFRFFLGKHLEKKKMVLPLQRL